MSLFHSNSRKLIKFTLLVTILGNLNLFAQNLEVDSIPLDSPKNELHYYYLVYWANQGILEGEVNDQYNAFSEKNLQVLLGEDLELASEALFIADNDDKSYLTIFRVDASDYRVWFTNKNQIWQKESVGQELSYLFKCYVGEYEILVLKYLESYTNGQNSSNYAVFTRKKEEDFYRIKKFQEVLIANRGENPEVIFHSNIAFELVEGELFAVQTFSHPKSEIKPYKMVDGKFISLF